MELFSFRLNLSFGWLFFGPKMLFLIHCTLPVHLAAKSDISDNSLRSRWRPKTEEKGK